MRTFKKDEIFPTPTERGNNPLLTIEEQLEDVALDLTRPISVDGTETHQVIISAPTVDDLIEARSPEGNAKDTQLRSLTKATGLPPEAIRELHARDFTRLTELYWGFTV